MSTRTRSVSILWFFCTLYIDSGWTFRGQDVRGRGVGDTKNNQDMQIAVLEKQYFTTRTPGLRIFEISFSSKISCLHSSSGLHPIFRFIPFSPVHNGLTNSREKKKSNLVSLVLLDLLPETGVLLDADLLGGVELVEAAQVHVLGQQGDHVLVEGLPVRVLEVVPVGEMESQAL